MTATIIFWIKLILWLVIAYSIFTIIKAIVKSRNDTNTRSKLFKSLAGDLISIAIGAFALFTIEKNYQAPFDKVMHSQNDVFPGFRFVETSSATEFAIENSLSELTIVNYWATWCGPCRREMPDLDSVQKKYSGKGLKVIAVSDESLETVQDFLRDKKFSFTTGVISLSNSTLDAINTRPVSILLDRNGKVLDMIVGSRGFDFFDNWVKRHLL
jgi:thiol-disulfide isomerase/thioredoxin